MSNKNYTSIASIISIVVGCLVLLGWRLDIAILKGVMWQLPAISPIAAFSFILAGISLHLLKSQPAQGWQLTLARASGLTVAIVGGIALTDYAFMPIRSLHDLITIWLIGFADDVTKTSPYAGAGLLLIGAALFLLDFTSRRGHYPAQWLALGAILIELFIITAFSYGIVPMQYIFHSPVKPHTGIMIMLLSYGILSARNLPQGIMTLLTNPSPGRLVLRRLLPFVVLGPMILGWFKVWGQNAGLFSESSGDAFIAIIGASIFSALLWHIAEKLNVLDIQQKETESLLNNTLETAPDGIIVCDDKHQILLINEQTEKMFGYTRDELLGQAIEVLMPEPLRGAHAQHQQNYIQQPKMRSMGQDLNIMGRRKDGSLFPVEISLSPHRHHGQLIVTTVVRDITERQRSKEALERQQRALVMLSSGNRTLLRSPDEDETQLLQAMCEVVIKVGGFHMAWIGYKVDDELKSVHPTAQSGFEQGYLEHAAITWGEDERGQGPTGRAVHTGQIQIANYFSTNPHMAPWREDALKHGYRAIIALPLKDKDTVFGALSIYSEVVDIFDDMEVAILDEMAADLSFGIITLRNNFARRKAEDELKVSYAMLESTLESTADGIVVTTLTGDILKYNQRFADIWSLPPTTEELGNCDKLVGHVCTQVSDGPGFIERTHGMYEVPSAVFKDVIELKDGRVIERIGHPHFMDGEVVGRVCSLHDITEQRKHEGQLTYLANHDALTGLPNRNLLSDRLHQAIAYASRLDEQIALLFIDLDRFKLINDSLGHDFGDHVLVELSKRLSECLRDEDTIARMGGDEFVILLPSLKREEDVATVAHKLLEAIARPCLINDRELLLEASIGVVLYPRDGGDVNTLLRRADAAMYRAKGRGGNSFKFYKHEIDAQVNRHLEIAGHLQNAIERNEFQVYYQPQFDLEKGRITGAEALIRWQHPIMGMVSPAEFIPIAEESNIILKIGEWVAETVIRQCKAWQSEGLLLTSVSINIAARQFDYSDLSKILSSLISKYNLDTSIFTLELELTEGMLMKHPEKIIQTLNELKAMNFSISIDDFGTGYSSLAYLKRFPIDKLKIDRSFVKDTPEDLDDVAIASAIIVMAHELGMKVVAEGVETEAQLALLRARGCDVIQGYLTGRPMSAQEFEVLLKSTECK